jgi:tripartite-type tricarboxylate transporter receptor subunit TctC
MLLRNAVGAVFGTALCAVVSGVMPVQAQSTFPTRPITMVVPLPAGGTADLLCRFASEKASAILGQQMVVENRPGGAGGRIGMEQVLRAPPDGYTLLCSTQLSYSITHLLFTKAAFDPRPLEPISVLATYPLIIILRKDFPANNLKEFIDYAKANAGKVTYGHQGKGNTGHLLGELMMLKSNFKMTEVPYRGSAPAINDTLSGTIDMVPDYLLANKGNIDAGKLKFIAVASERRLKDRTFRPSPRPCPASPRSPGWRYRRRPARRRRSPGKYRMRSGRGSSNRTCRPVSSSSKQIRLAPRLSRCEP